VKAEVKGTAAVAIQVGGPTSHLKLPDSLVDGISRARTVVINPLIPYLWVAPSPGH